MKKPEDIVTLIKSLTGPEKRYFKVFVSKNSIGESNHYLKLFDLIDKTGSSERKDIEKLYANEAFMKKQFRAYKHLLYEQILNSLKSYHSKGSVDDEIMELIREAKILHDKNLYKQAENILEKAKRIAHKYERHTLLLEIMRWQKKIINTFSSYEKEDEKIIYNLSDEENLVINTIANTNDIWKPVTLMFFSVRKNGIARNKEDIDKYNKLIGDLVLENDEFPKSFRARLFFYYLHSNYFSSTNNKEKGSLYIKKIVALMEANPHHIEDEPDNYFNALLNLLYNAKILKKYNEFFALVPKVKLMIKKFRLQTTQLFRVYNFEFVAYIDTGQFQKAMQLLPKIEAILEEEKNYDELTKIYYSINKILLHYGNKDYHQSLTYINLLLNNNNKNYLRPDLHCFAKMFQLIVHFDKENYDFLPYLVKSIYRYLLKQNKLHQFELIIIHFIRIKLPHINSKKEQTEAFKSLQKELMDIGKDPLEARFLELFDIISWLESKIENRPFEEILQEKAGLVD